MTGNKQALPGAKSKGLEKGGADRGNDRARLQDTTPAEISQDFQTYRRGVRRMMADAFVMAQDFPARLRFSYYVDRRGKLIPRAERRAGT